MTATQPTPDAAGPVEAVLGKAIRAVHTQHGDDHSPEFLAQALATALAPLFTEHGAAERRAGAVEALNEAADETLASPSTRLGDLHPGEVWAEWLRARAAALGDRADEAGASYRPPVDPPPPPYQPVGGSESAPAVAGLPRQEPTP